MVTAPNRWWVFALSVICLNPKLHSHNPSQGPEVSPALARLHERCGQCGGSTGEGFYLFIIIVKILLLLYFKFEHNLNDNKTKYFRLWLYDIVSTQCTQITTFSTLSAPHSAVAAQISTFHWLISPPSDSLYLISPPSDHSYHHLQPTQLATFRWFRMRWYGTKISIYWAPVGAKKVPGTSPPESQLCFGGHYCQLGPHLHTSSCCYLHHTWCPSLTSWGTHHSPQCHHHTWGSHGRLA